MTRRRLGRLLFGREVLTLFVLLVAPVAIGAVETSLVTPLALPGYLMLTVGSAIGSHLLPSYALWLFWLPFAVGSYGLAVVGGAACRLFRGRLGADDGSRADG